MKIFTNKDIRNFFILTSGVSGGILALIQLMLFLSYGELNPAILLLSLLVVISILGDAFYTFKSKIRSWRMPSHK